MSRLLKLSTLTVFSAIAAAAAVGGGETPAAAAETGTAVAPKAPKTRQQLWASVAWAAEAKSGLVVWREGFLNEEKGSIWCARVSADGQALDRAGVLVADGPGMRDRPRVASDGRGFLVVWEDLRNGKDWDIYAARVSAAGKCLNAGGFKVASGAHNQCRPDVIFTAGNYYAVWMGFTDGYDVYGARISPAGKVLEPNGRKVADFGKGLGTQAIAPVLALQGDKMLLSVIAARLQYARGTQTLFSIDPATGKSTVLPAKLNVSNERVRMGALAAGPNGACLVTAGGRGRSGGKYRYRMTCLTPSGTKVGKSLDLYKRVGGGFMFPRMVMARVGKNYLFACDYGVLSGNRRTGYRMRTEIHGWRITPDGKVSPNAEKGFVLVASPKHDLVLPALAAGPGGSVLVVCSEVRGPDDVKVICRVVK